MYDLTLIKQDGGCYIDSREVADAIGKRHHNLLRDINGYIETMQGFGAINFDYSDFFVPSTYQSEQNKQMPCFLISKMGAEVIANKLTGEKGVLFTVAYVRKFNEMEAAERAELEAMVAEAMEMPAPRLGEFNACARIIIRAMRENGATPEQIVGFLIGVDEPLGISIMADIPGDAPRLYTAKQIAQTLGVYSVNGNPHYLAVACILNENIFIGDGHKTVMTEDYGNHVGICVRYDGYALNAVKEWLCEYGYPEEVYGFGRTYRVLYRG
jgi:Rha family phage regulatory protein